MEDEDVQRLFIEDYLPTDQDIMHAQAPRVGLGVNEIVLDEGLRTFSYRIFELPTQETIRQKRFSAFVNVQFSAFGNVQFILFVALITGYDKGNPNFVRFRFAESSYWTLTRVE